MNGFRKPMWLPPVIVLSVTINGTSSAQTSTHSSPASPAASARQPTSAADWRRWIRDLGAPAYQTREAAEKKLASVGPEVLELLQQAVHDSDAERARRVRRLIRQITRTQALQQLEAVRVSVHWQQVPLGQALDELSRRTGNTVTLSEADPPPRQVSLQVQNATFWEMLDHICRAAELTPVLGSRPLQLQPGVPPQVPTAYTGPLRLRVRSLSAHRYFTGSPRTLRMMVELAWEPRVTPLMVSFNGSPKRAADDSGADLTRPASGSLQRIPVYSARGVNSMISLQMSGATPGATLLTEVAGELLVTFEAARHPFRFQRPAFLTDVQEAYEDFKVTLNKFTPEQNHWTAQVTVESPPSRLQDSHYRLNRAHALTLVGPNNTLVSARNHRVLVQQLGLQQFSYTFVDIPFDPAEADLVYELPVLTVDKTIPYQLRDIPLP